MSEGKYSFTSTSGFEYSLDQEAMDDLEIFDLIRAANSPDNSAIEQADALFKAFVLVIGNDQDAALRTFLKERDGKVKTSAYREELAEVFTSLGKNKKK